MDICIIGSDRSDRVTEFRRFAQENGCNVHLTSFEETEPTMAPISGGVVIFDDGARSTANWVTLIREKTRYLSVPLIAVAAGPRDSEHARLLTAGASSVCSTNAACGDILMELQMHNDNQPVLEDLRSKLLEPFTTAAMITLREMASTEITVRSVYQKLNYLMFGDISAVIGLISTSPGSMVLSFPEKTAAAVVGRILAGVDEEPDRELIRDCVGEIANVIAGQAKGILAGSPYHFSMSTPTIVSGAGHEIGHKPGMPCLVLAFASDVGDFALQLCLKV